MTVAILAGSVSGNDICNCIQCKSIAHDHTCSRIKF